MKDFFKKRIGLIILLVAIFAFPSSLSTQARLNMRAIVTGLAIDKVDDKYEVTAQIVKTSPSTESGGEKATVNFVSDNDETVIGAISKLSYKTGKTSAFSHTNFIIIGKDVLEEDLTQTLDYFMRDNITNDSMLLLVAEEKASNEIKKTKDVELSIAIGLQKVFMYREKEGDGVMNSVLEFMKDSKESSGTSVVSLLALEKNDEQSEDNPTGGGSSSSSGSSGESGTEDGGEQGGGSKYQYFKAQTELGCFVDGRYVGKLEKDEVLGYMLANKKATIDDVYAEDFDKSVFNAKRVGVKIKDKTNKLKIRYENNIPCLDLVVKIKNSAIYEIQSEEFIDAPTDAEFSEIKNGLKKKIAENVSKCFEKSKELKADIWGAYLLAQKHHYKQTNMYYKNREDFLSNLKLNVIVEIDRLEY
ncbi:MAG: hypothetical protein E7341_00630 [Clostridiales bacterium]|nr:hypothetical protein [Clostridiales bacterium]